MSNQATSNDRLDGWVAIADYLGWHSRTVIRWEKQKGLPVHRVGGGKRQPVYAYRHEIDHWFKQSDLTSDTSPPLIPLLEVEKPSGVPPVASSTKRYILSKAYVASAVAIAALLMVGIALRLEVPAGFEVTGITQLSDDGSAKRSLLTDGKRLYFREEAGNRAVISTMSVDGGPMQQLALPLTLRDPYPADVSSDGKVLLVFSASGVEEERQLWIVPTGGGAPYQVAGVQAHTAAFSPNGGWIAFGKGRTINLVSSDGTHSRTLSKLDGFAESLHWSGDGKRLLFFIRRPESRAFALSYMDIDDRLLAGKLISVNTFGNDCCAVEQIAGTANGFFAFPDVPAPSQLLYLHWRPWRQAVSLESSALNMQFQTINGLAADTKSKRLFVLSGTHLQGDSIRYDAQTRSFTMMLSGVAATEVDISRRSGLAAYVRRADGTLWIGNLDGSEARQVSPAGMAVELPRWSPDEKRIAFMGRLPDRPWRIFIVPSEGGTPREAGKSDDNQGAPTWSLDGRFLIYGNVYCLGDGTCAIHRINLASGAVTTIPDSKGLATARWSPNGKYIAALNSTDHEVYILDVGHRGWRRLANDINGNDLSWSTDSKFIFATSSMNGPQRIARIPVIGGPEQIVLDIDSLGKSVGRLDPGFSLTPDNALILNRWISTSEIYALKYSGR
jgi:Tol biopolymer transport system component